MKFKENKDTTYESTIYIWRFSQFYFGFFLAEKTRQTSSLFTNRKEKNQKKIMLKTKSCNFLQVREFQLSAINQSKASKRRKVFHKVSILDISFQI